jgi:hypothetical protein
VNCRNVVTDATHGLKVNSKTVVTDLVLHWKCTAKLLTCEQFKSGLKLNWSSKLGQLVNCRIAQLLDCKLQDWSSHCANYEWQGHWRRLRLARWRLYWAMQKRLSTILGLCTAKAECATVCDCNTTVPKPNLLKQLPHRKWLTHCAMQVGLQAVTYWAMQHNCPNTYWATAAPHDWARLWDCALQRLILAVTWS